MSTVPERVLRKLLKDIEPTQAQKLAAQRSHNYLRNLMYGGQIGSRIVEDYLSGSYSRNTTIRPLDDVDIVFVIDSSKWNISLFATFPLTEAVLSTFARAVRYRYEVAPVYGQRKSVGLRLAHLNIDIVPAIQDDDDVDVIYIPDRETGDWIKSSPRIHSDVASAVNLKQFRLFKPLVKLLKFWNGNLPGTASLKSFAIETIATRLFADVVFRTLKKDCYYFLTFSQVL